MKVAAVKNMLPRYRLVLGPTPQLRSLGRNMRDPPPPVCRCRRNRQLAVMRLDDESVIAPVESLPEVSRKILFLLFAINVEAPSVCSQGFYVKFYLQLKSH